MNSEELRYIAELAQTALERAPSAPETFVASACTNEQHIADAQTLTRAAATVGAMLESLDVGAEGAKHCGAGEMLGHYEVVEWLGAGGMGEVFRVRDVALGRSAALKRLPTRFTSELRRRLLLEAEASAKLQHPAIATFYETGEWQGEAFIAMEFVAGDTLRARLNAGALPIEEALRVARCLLEALEHAHAAGVIHCDIKPENIMVTGPGAAKLLDFGLARQLFASGATPPTAGPRGAMRGSAARIAGTLGYMAPEQLRGEVLDVRTDVFQVALVLYEMLCGRRALSANSPVGLLAAVLHEDLDLSVLRAHGVPAPLCDVIHRAAARERARRHPTAAAFLRELEDVMQSGVATALPRTVAVVDWANQTGDSNLDWIGNGVAERVTSVLDRGVTVLGRDRIVRANELLRAQSRETDPETLGRHLGCRSVISGTVAGSPASLSIALTVTESATGRVTATHSVSGSVQQLASLEDAVATVAATTVGCAPSGRNAARSSSLEARESYARARGLLDHLSKGSVEQAIELLERAAAIDPEYVPALAGLAWAYGFRSIATTDPADLDRAFSYAERALARDAGNADAHLWRAYALLRRGEYDEAAGAARQATRFGPANATAPYFAGSALMFAGRSADALPFLQRSLELDAHVGMAWLALGAAHLALSQLREAHSSFKRACRLEGLPVKFPTAGAAAYVAEVLRRLGDLDDARAQALEGLDSSERSDHAYRDFFRAHALVVLGRTAFDQGDIAAARVAFHQVLGQANGRPRTRSCGQLVVQALAGLARADQRPELITEGESLLASRDRYNFEPFFGALDEQTRCELVDASRRSGGAERSDLA